MKTIVNKTDIYPESKFNLDSVLFFDIETTGLSREYSNVYLIGCAYKKDGAFNVVQFFAENRGQEGEIVNAFYEFAKGFKTLVHFNGIGFDVPYMDHKAEAYKLESRLSDMENYDILKRARLAKKLLGIQKMSQKSIEEFLKIKRDDEMGGGELIGYYFEYERTQDERLLKYLLLHNHDDVLGMLRISGITNYADIPEGNFDAVCTEETEDYVTINLRLNSALPMAFEKEEGSYIFAANDDIAQLVLKKYKGIAYYYLDDYQNYYYLPEEDRVVHKDVAQFVDKAHRVKAKKNNCYIKKDSIFLPYNVAAGKECFCHPDNKKIGLMEASKINGFNEEMLKNYALEIIRE